MTDIKYRKVVLVKEHSDALRAYEELQKKIRHDKLADALDLARACVLSTHQIRPDIVDELVRFADAYISTLREAVRAQGGTSVEIIATFPEGKVTIDKFSR
jgi:hypothetical protein